MRLSATFALATAALLLPLTATAQEEVQLGSSLGNLLASWLPFLILLAGMFYFLRLAIKQQKYIDRAGKHMERVEQLLEQIHQSLNARQT